MGSQPRIRSASRLLNGSTWGFDRPAQQQPDSIPVQDSSSLQVFQNKKAGGRSLPQERQNENLAEREHAPTASMKLREAKSLPNSAVSAGRPVRPDNWGENEEISAGRRRTIIAVVGDNGERIVDLLQMQNQPGRRGQQKPRFFGGR